jgi:hypothetical protein
MTFRALKSTKSNPGIALVDDIVAGANQPVRQDRPATDPGPKQPLGPRGSANADPDRLIEDREA